MFLPIEEFKRTVFGNTLMQVVAMVTSNLIDKDLLLQIVPR